MQAIAYTMHFELGIEPVSKRALLDCLKYCLSILTKIKLLITNVETAQLVFSVVVFLLKYNFCLHNILYYNPPINFRVILLATLRHVV